MGAAMLKIWGRANSSNVQKVLWVADELGLACERIDAGGAFGGTAEPSYRAMNPNGLVPTIDDDGFVLWESNTIVRYLATRERAHALLPDTGTPESIRARAEVEKWMDWASTALSPATFAAFWGLIRTPEERRDRAAIVASAEKTVVQLQIMEAALATRTWLAGDRFTLADVPAGILTWRWYGLPLAQVGFTRPTLPNLEAWRERLAERPAYRRWVMHPLT
jgi:glutathione S-transferase